MNPLLIYCYDAYCGWCYGFGPVIKKIANHFKDKIDIEVLSGGIMVDENKMPIQKIAPFINTTYKRIEEITGAKFGDDFLWHINNPAKSDWIMNSLKPAIALCIFKEYYVGQQLNFANDLQYALNYEGRDLDDDEAYRHLLKKYNIAPNEFFKKLKSTEYKQKAYAEFALCKKLNANSFPQVILQITENKFYQIASGFTDYKLIKEKIEGYCG